MKINRVLDDYRRWQDGERMIAKELPQAVSREGFLKAKLSHLEKIRRKYTGTENIEERIALIAIKEDVKRLEERLYPNRGRSFLLRLFRPLLLKKELKREALGEKQAQEQLRDEVARIGFGQAKEKIDRLIAKGVPAFKVPVSYYTAADRKMDFLLHFKTDGDGKYEMTGYDAALTMEGSETVVRGQSFTRDAPFTALHVQHLLEGRAVQLNDQAWRQLDFNDRDASGDFVMKVFPPDYGFDLEKEINKLAAGIDKEELEQKLKDGEAAMIELEISGKKECFEVTADPQYGRLLIQGTSGKRVGLNELLNPKKEQEVNLSVANSQNLAHMNVRKHGLTIV
ncbi:hypothetical protein LX66_1921 [Chitinophaga japonensis]|uniref:DUF3945 domain-containing protein n=2 Tax=Chitinophaga japonensis TaxID=104662 RepID=A0A562T4B1_CHIJA|nr:hypothetical protein LX66_1921 [Chitinophaga japonensis]